jgi:hypothetical protein
MFLRKQIIPSVANRIHIREDSGEALMASN